MGRHHPDCAVAVRRMAPILAAAAALLVVGATPVRAQTTQTAAQFFKQNCTSCHTIGGGRLTGPDLKGVTDRRDRSWLARFLPDPKAMIDGGDPVAKGLVDEARGVVMPTLQGMTPARVQEIIDFLAAESKQARSAFAGSQVIERPFTPQDVAAGRAIFEGTQRLTAGGPPCASCHAVGSLRALGGGRLGPDSTLAVERLQGRKGLTAWLGAPATSTMQSVFGGAPMQPEEIIALTAFLDDAARTTQPADSVAQLNFFMLGLGGAVFGLVVADTVWKRRFRAVRRPLVESGGARGGAR